MARPWVQRFTDLDLDKAAEAYQYFMQAALVDLEDLRQYC